MTDLDALRREAERFLLARRVSPKLFATAVTHEQLTDLIQRLLPALEDARRLDLLDQNTKMRMGWRVARAPAGNLSVTSVIQVGDFPVTSIREAIDSAMEKADGK